MQLTAVLTLAEVGGFVALNPETGACSQGESVEEALANLREAAELCLEEFPMAGGAGDENVTPFGLCYIQGSQQADFRREQKT